MAGVIVCVVGVVCILALAEVLWQQKILRGEWQRKFVHAAGGTFVAFWPWLVSWQTIQLLGLALLAGALLNRYRKVLHYQGEVSRESYGDIFSALAITTCAALTTTPIFFCLAILHLALADSVAAIVGTQLGKKWQYKVFRQTKTVYGSMAFWLASVSILAAGLLFVSDLIPFETYAVLLLTLPPLLTMLENLSVLGSDNLVIPVTVLAALEAVQTL